MTTPPIMTINDELLAELEAAANYSIEGCSVWYEEDGFVITLADTCDRPFMAKANPATILALLQHVRELKADAERYRWLREKHDEVEGDVWVSVWNSEELCWGSLDASCRPEYDGDFDLDAAIDAARSSADYLAV